jgi:hypothetical protein
MHRDTAARAADAYSKELAKLKVSMPAEPDVT